MFRAGRGKLPAKTVDIDGRLYKACVGRTRSCDGATETYSDSLTLDLPGDIIGGVEGEFLVGWDRGLGFYLEGPPRTIDYALAHEAASAVRALILGMDDIWHEASGSRLVVVEEKFIWGCFVFWRLAKGITVHLVVGAIICEKSLCSGGNSLVAESTRDRDIVIVTKFIVNLGSALTGVLEEIAASSVSPIKVIGF